MEVFQPNSASLRRPDINLGRREALKRGFIETMLGPRGSKISDFCEQELVGRIISFECFQETHHEFVLVHAMGLYPDTPTDQSVWIRLERGMPDKNGATSKFGSVIWRDVPIYDNAIIAYDRDEVTPPRAICQEKLEFTDPVSLEYLVLLLRMMDQTGSGYNHLKVSSLFCNQGE